MPARQNAGHRPPDRQEELHKPTRSLVCTLWKCLLVQLHVVLALLTSIKLFQEYRGTGSVLYRARGQRGGYRVSAAYNIVDINTLQARGCTVVGHGSAVSGLGSNCQYHRLQRRSILVNATIVIWPPY